MEKRLNWIDNLRGVGIILVVWGHMNLPLPAEHWIYSFHMPLFFMISGYLYRSKPFDKKFISRKFTSLIVPYFIFAIPSNIFGILKGDGVRESILALFYIDGIGWNAPVWFLIVLFFSSLIYAGLDRAHVNKHIIGIGAFVVGFFISNTGTYPLGLDKIIYGVFFMYAGSLLKDFDGKAIVEKSKNYILVACLVINVLFGLILNPRISLYNNEIGNYFFFVIAAVAGSAFLFILMQKIVPMKLLEFYGRNAIVIIGTHYFFLFGFRFLETVLNTTLLTTDDNLLMSIAQALFILIAEIPIIVIYNSVIKFLSENIKKLNTKREVAE